MVIKRNACLAHCMCAGWGMSSWLSILRGRKYHFRWANIIFDSITRIYTYGWLEVCFSTFVIGHTLYCYTTVYVLTICICSSGLQMFIHHNNCSQTSISISVPALWKQQSAQKSQRDDHHDRGHLLRFVDAAKRFLLRHGGEIWGFDK